MKQSTSITLLFIFLLAVCLFMQTPLLGQPPKIAKAGDPAPDFSLVDFHGKKFTFTKAKNEKVRVFWFTNLCSGCQSVILEMEKIKNLFESKGVEIVCVSQLGEDRATVERIIKEKRLTLRFLYDPKGDATSLYSGRFTPGACPLKSVYIIQKNGTIQFASHFPGTPVAELKNQIERALSIK